MPARMRRWMVAIGIASYGLALVASAPATLADSVVRAQTAGRLGVADARGTLWAGSGRLEVQAADRRGAMGIPLEWHWLPGALMRARLGFSVRVDAENTPFRAAISFERIEFEEVHVSLPAAALGFGAPVLASLALSGELRIDIPKLSVGRRDTTGQVTVRWTGAGSALSPVSPLGDYEARLAADGPTLNVSLATLQGPLTLDGHGSWPIGARPAFLATARVPPELHAQLGPFLRLFTVERADHAFELLVN